MEKKIGRILLLAFGLFFAAYMVALFVFLAKRGVSLWERVVVLLMMLALFAAIVGLCKLLEVTRRKRDKGAHAKKVVATASEKQPTAAKNHPTSSPKELKSEADAAKEQEIAAARAESEKAYRDFMSEEGRLPEGFSEKYHTSTKSGYILRQTPFEEYLHKIWQEVDALNDSTNILEWLYFDGSLEINAAIEKIVDWGRRYRETDAQWREKRGIGALPIVLPLGRRCGSKIMVVMENGDAFQKVTEQSIASCKAGNISFSTILSSCELYDLIEQKAKIIEYEKYPGYHDETYADWWFVDSPAKSEDA